MTHAIDTSSKAYLTLEEAAQIARSSTVTIRRAIAAKRLSACKPNGKYGKTLIRPGDLARYLECTRRLSIGEMR